MNKPTPYYTGDPINLAFRAREKGQGLLKVTSATVSLFGSQGEIFIDAPCEFEEDLIEYTIPGASVDIAGDYKAEFQVNIQPDITRTHIIKFRVLSREPVFTEEQDKFLMPLDETATEYATDGAIGQTIRMLRRAGHAIQEAARISSDLAQKMTNRRF